MMAWPAVEEVELTFSYPKGIGGQPTTNLPRWRY
jgi:hypothetical protein